jgi:hypothetical protein
MSNSLLKNMPLYNQLNNIDKRDKSFSNVIFWNLNIETWLAYLDLPPTKTSRILYYFHLWYYSLYLALIKKSTKNIFPSWMNFSISTPDFVKSENPQNMLVYGAYYFCKSVFTTYIPELNDILTFCLDGTISSDSDTWIHNLTDSFITKMNTDYSAATTNPTWTSAYVSPIPPGGNSTDPSIPSGAWRPLEIPNGTFTNSWNIPWADLSNPSTYVTQNYATPNWGGVIGYEWNRVGPFNSSVQNILDKYTPYLSGTNFNDQMMEVKDYNTNLTPRQKFIAEFWEAGSKTAKPCGMWNQICRIITKSLGMSEDQCVELFFILNAAIANAFILAWDVKRTYANNGGERPVTYLRRVLNTPFTGWKGNNDKTGIIDPAQPNQGFLPYQEPTFITPPFPGFISGHSTCSSAAATILSTYLGSGNFADTTGLKCYTNQPDEFLNSFMNIFGVIQTKDSPYLVFDTSSDYPKTVLAWKDFLFAANEAGMSRLYGGIHPLVDHLGGRDIGQYIANYTWNAYKNK